MIIQFFLFLFPWKLRRILLNKIFNYKIAPTAKIGFSFILAKELVMNDKARIDNFTVCKKIDRLIMNEYSYIGSWNLITGFSKDDYCFRNEPGRRCEFVLEENSGITLRHYIDCNGGIYVGAFTTIAGVGSQILTHSIDVYENCQRVKPVHIGKYCFLGTKCVVLAGAKLPDYSVLAAGSVLTRPYTSDKSYVYGGVPAKMVKELDIHEVEYFHRSSFIVE